MRVPGNPVSLRSVSSVLCLVAVLATAPAAAVTFGHGPWIAHVEKSLVVISWDTDVDSPSVVNYGLTTAYGSQVAGSDATVGASGWANHVVIVTGLQPDTQYYYQVVSGNASSPAGQPGYWFRTAVEGATPYRFVSMADSRGDSAFLELSLGLPANFIEILGRVRALDPFPRFVVFSGDEVYGDDDLSILREEWDQWKDATELLHRNIPIYISPGNHESYHDGAEDLFRAEWEQPHGGGLTPFPSLPWDLDELAYSFDHGVVHFTSYDTNIHDDPLDYNAPPEETAWLATDLAAAVPMHRVVFGHTEGANPCIFGLGASLEETSQANYLAFYGAMAQHGVGAYVCGHIHNWVGDMGIMGIREVMNGTCGSISSTSFCGIVADHYVVWDVDCGTIQGRVFDQDDNPVDERGSPFTITATNATPPDVDLLSPTPGTTLCGSTLLEASASAFNCESIARVEFRVDATLVGSVAQPPYQLTWDSASVPDGPHTIVARAVDTTGSSGLSTDSAPIAVNVDNSAPCTGFPANILTGAGAGQPNPNVGTIWNASGAQRAAFVAYATGKWGTNVEGGDIDGDAVGEALTGPGPGDVFGPHVRAFRRDGSPMAKVSFYAYGTLKYGVNVSAGDMDGDAPREILTGPGPGAVFGPHVRAFNFDGAALTPVAKVSFFAYFTLKYGVNVDGAGMDGDAFDEMLTGPGPGQVFGPQARAFDYDGASVSAIAKINSFLFTVTSYGLEVGGGTLDGDAFEEILGAKGPGVGFDAQVRGFDYDGTALVPLPGVDFLAFTGSTQGASVASGDIDLDGFDEIVAGPGPAPLATARVKGFNVDGGTATPIPTTDFLAYPSLGYGTRVASIDANYP